MAITAAQREARKQYIGASDVPTIFGYNRFKSAYDLWLEKTGQLTGEEETSEAAEMGTDMEPVIAAGTERRLGCRIVKPTGTYIAENGIMIANLDRQVEKAIRGKPPVELKATCVPDGWGEPGSDQVPDAVLFQVQTQMLCTEAEVAHVARLLFTYGWPKIEVYTVRRHEKLIQIIEDGVCEFWQNHVLAEKPPPDSVPSLDVISRRIRVSGKHTTVDVKLVRAFNRARDARLRMEKREEKNKAALIAALGDAESADAGPFAVHYSVVNNKTLNRELLEKKYPGATAECTIAGSYRKLMVKQPKDKESKV